MLPTPRNLFGDVLRCWADYSEQGLPPARRVAYCALRVGQRSAYYVGWVAGAPALRRLSSANDKPREGSDGRS